MPLDQKGPIGAATILGCLQCGLGYLQHSHLEMPLWEESRMMTAPSDATFMSRLHASTPTSMLPPLSILVMRPSPSLCMSTITGRHATTVSDMYGASSRMPLRIARLCSAAGTRALRPFAKGQQHVSPLSVAPCAGARRHVHVDFSSPSC